MLGTLPALGNWQPDQALRLTRLESPHWQAEASAERLLSNLRLLSGAGILMKSRGACDCCLLRGRS